MHILEIKIENFTTHKDTYINFRVLRPVIFVIGNNGAGKTSIIEAISYALYGKTRFGGTEITYGADFMQVELVAVSPFKKEIKIVRKKEKKRQTLEVYEKIGDRWEIVNGASQELQSFINENFNEKAFALGTSLALFSDIEKFTTLNAKERRDVLLNVMLLNAEEYQRILDKVKRKITELSAVVNVLTEDLAEMKKSLANKKYNPRTIENLKQAIAQNELLLSSWQERLAQVPSGFEIEKIELQIKELQEKIRQYSSEINYIHGRLSALENKFSTIGEIELNNDILAVVAKSDYIIAFVKFLDTLMSDLMSQISETQTRINLLTTQKREIRQRYNELQSTISAMRKKIADQKTATEILEKTGNEISRVQKSIQDLTKENEQLMTIMKLKKSVIVAIENRKRSVCPVCMRPLVELSTGHITETGKEQAQVYRERQTQIKQLSEQLVALQKEYENHQKKCNDYERVGNEIKNTESRAQEIWEQIKSIEVEIEQLKKRETALVAFLDTLKTSPTQTVSRALQTGDLHKYCGENLPDWALWLNECPVSEVDRLVVGHLKRVYTINQAIEDIKFYASRKDDMQKLNAEIKVKTQLKNHAEDQVRELREVYKKYNVNAILSEVERIQQQIKDQREHLEALQSIADMQVEAEERVKKIAENIEKHKEKIELLKRLRAALNNDVKINILRDTVQNLEGFINTFLENLSAGRLRVKLFFDSKSGLEMAVVFNEQYECGYQSLSGGERFILDISVKIGIMRWIAHITKSNFELLVLDEGLGVLDDESINLLAQAIKSLVDDFKQIIIITHVKTIMDNPALKDVSSFLLVKNGWNNDRAANVLPIVG